MQEPGNLRALVTGASGFYRREACRRLHLNGDWSFGAMVRNPKRPCALHHSPVTVETVDLLDTAGDRRITSGRDIVFHCAVVTSETGDRKLFHQADVKAQESGRRCPRGTDIKIHSRKQCSRTRVFDPPRWGSTQVLPCQLSGKPLRRFEDRGGNRFGRISLVIADDRAPDECLWTGSYTWVPSGLLNPPPVGTDVPPSMGGRHMQRPLH